MVVKKKYWDVELEIVNNVVQLLAASQDELVGRVVKLDLTKMMRGKNCEAKFKLVKEDGKVVGKMYSLIVLGSHIRRVIGHGTSIIEDSFSCKAKDAVFRVKPFLIARKKIHRSVRNALRNEARNTLNEFFKEETKDRIFEAALSGILQKTLSKKLKKVYPLAVCELRVIEVEKGK